MLEACRRVMSYSQNLSREAFLNDLKTRDAVIRNLELLGEASKQVPADIPDDFGFGFSGDGWFAEFDGAVLRRSTLSGCASRHDHAAWMEARASSPRPNDCSDSGQE